MATYKKPLPPGAAMQEPQQASSLPPDVLKLIDGAGLTSEMDDAGLAARRWSMRRFGQTGTGFVEDAIVFGSGLAVVSPSLGSCEAC